MKTNKFDKAFDNGEDVTKHLDLKKADRPGLKTKRVNVDFPEWMLQQLDEESKRLVITRQSVIKVWIAEKLQDSSIKNF